MINVRTAALKARNYLLQLVGVSSVMSVAVEEAEQTPNGAYWLITIGYNMRGLPSIRQYRVLKIDGTTGEVVSMKIRNF